MIELLDELKKQLEQKQQDDSVAVEAALVDFPNQARPKTLGDACVIIAQLLRRQESQTESIKILRDSPPQLLAEALTGIDGFDTATFDTLGKKIKELQSIQLMWRSIPGLSSLFQAANPLLKCAEAAAVHMHGDRVAKESYMRRRAWIMRRIGSWEDPLNKTGTLPFDTAMLVQVKRDIEPFRGLASRQWQPEAQSPKLTQQTMDTTAEPEPANEESSVFDEIDKPEPLAVVTAPDNEDLADSEALPPVARVEPAKQATPAKPVAPLPGSRLEPEIDMVAPAPVYTGRRARPRELTEEDFVFPRQDG